MKEPTPADVRAFMLDDLKAIVEVCNCDWPVVTMRNGHGHRDDCPAAAVRTAQAGLPGRGRRW